MTGAICPLSQTTVQGAERDPRGSGVSGRRPRGGVPPGPGVWGQSPHVRLEPWSLSTDGWRSGMSPGLLSRARGVPESVVSRPRTRTALAAVFRWRAPTGGASHSRAHRGARHLLMLWCWAANMLCSVSTGARAVPSCP